MTYWVIWRLRNDLERISRNKVRPRDSTKLGSLRIGLAMWGWPGRMQRRQTCTKGRPHTQVRCPRKWNKGGVPRDMIELDVLLTEIRACQICASHLPLGPRPILQVHREAVILIAGQAPGRRVHASGIPFQDPSGVRLREWMGVSEEVFFDPRRVAVLPMGFCFPGSGRSGDKPPSVTSCL